MPPTPMCLIFVIDHSEPAERKVLLGLKRLGFGAGNVVGLGGHVEEGEDALTAAVREAREEAGIVIDSADVAPAGLVRFRFPSKPGWDQDVAVFVTSAWEGSPEASDEIEPCWYPVDGTPFHDMWDDARYWLPRVLGGDRVDGTVIFGDDNRTVVDARLD